MKTREEVLTVQEAGRRGGLQVKTKLGSSFYRRIGRKGQKAMRAKYPTQASEWGKMGGRPIKPTIGEDGRQVKH